MVPNMKFLAYFLRHLKNITEVQPEPLEQLSPSETKRFQHLLTVIKHFNKSLRETGAALAEIRDKKLYRETHPTFEAFVHDTVDLARQRAYELIDFDQTLKVLSSRDDIDVQTLTEYQTRPLRDLPPEDKIEVVIRAKERALNGTITAELMKETKDDLLASRPGPRPSRKPQKQLSNEEANKRQQHALKRALDHIQSVLGPKGKQFRATIEGGQYISKPDDVIILSNLNDSLIRHVAKRLQQGWIFSEAISEAVNIPTPDSEIRDLHRRAMVNGGRCRVTIDHFEHVVCHENHVHELDAKLKDWPVNVRP